MYISIYTYAACGSKQQNVVSFLHPRMVLNSTGSSAVCLAFLISVTQGALNSIIVYEVGVSLLRFLACQSMLAICCCGGCTCMTSPSVH